MMLNTPVRHKNALLINSFNENHLKNNFSLKINFKNGI